MKITNHKRAIVVVTTLLLCNISIIQAQGTSGSPDNILLPQPCINANGEIVEQGGKTILYETSKNGSKSQSKECKKGALIGDTSYQFYYYSPTLEDRKNCKRGNKTIPEYATVIAYRDKYITRDQTCSFVQKICIQGKLVGPNAGSVNYNEESCQFINAFDPNHKNKFPNHYDMIGNILPETLLIPPLGNGKSCNTPRGEVIPSGETVFSFQKQFGPGQGVCEYKISVCIDGNFDNPLRKYNSCIKKRPDNQNDEQCHAQESLQKQLNACIDDKDNMLSVIHEYEEKLKACYPDFVPSPLFNTTNAGRGKLEKEPCKWNGQTIKDGESITAFQKGHWEKGKFVCPQETRTCNNGELSGTYTEPKCNNPGHGPHRCPTPIGPISHGKSITLYKDKYVAYPGECESQIRECSYGKLQGDKDYDEPSCKQTGELCDLPRGGTVGHGTLVTAFSKTQVPYGSKCDEFSLQRKCIDGKLTGSDKYKYSTCENENPKGCPLEGGIIAHGQTVTRYKESTIITPVETQGPDLCKHQSRTCTNGTWKTLEGEPASFTYSFKSCEIVAPGENISN